MKYGDNSPAWVKPWTGPDVHHSSEVATVKGLLHMSNQLHEIAVLLHHLGVNSKELVDIEKDRDFILADK